MESKEALDSKKNNKPIKKRAPHKLTVDDSKDDENSIVVITEEKRSELNLLRGETILLKGKRRKEG